MKTNRSLPLFVLVLFALVLTACGLENPLAPSTSVPSPTATVAVVANTPTPTPTAIAQATRTPRPTRTPTSEPDEPTPTRTPSNTPTETPDVVATAVAATVQAIGPTSTATLDPVAQVVQATLAASTPVSSAPGAITASVYAVFTATGALAYPDLIEPDPSRQLVFPDVPNLGRPALVVYELPFEDGDYFEDGEGDVDLPQFYFRVMTAGTIKISQLGVDCVSTPTKGCAVILVNHFGPTETFRNAEVDNGFTIAGRVWDMSSPDLVTLAAQALLDHYMHRMTEVEDGANCGVITACESVEWNVVVVGNGERQAHWQGLYQRP